MAASRGSDVNDPQRYGVVTDVHGNLYALQTALEHLRAAGAERLLCLGDVIGYGPHPSECLELLGSFDPTCVAGNHEQMALGRLSSAGSTETARRSLEWTRTQLTPAAQSVLERWPLVTTAPGVVLAHGSPGRVDEYVRSDSRARELLDQLSSEHPPARVLLLGHTHEAWAFSRVHGTQLRARPGRVSLEQRDLQLLNPGSVGQSRDRHPHARFLLLDLAEGVADFRSVPYDVAACRRALKDRGLPPDWCHVVPPLHERFRGMVGDALRRLGVR